MFISTSTCHHGHRVGRPAAERRAVALRRDGDDVRVTVPGVAGRQIVEFAY
jgi:hypothetical protein